MTSTTKYASPSESVGRQQFRKTSHMPSCSDDSLPQDFSLAWKEILSNPCSNCGDTEVPMQANLFLFLPNEQEYPIFL